MPTSGRKLRDIVVGALVATLLLCGPGSAGHRLEPPFLADLLFYFDCSGDADPPSEQTIERFLADDGFKVANFGRLQRGRGGQPISNLFIDGLDQGSRMIRFTAIPSVDGAYNVGLYTPPPTQHLDELETALLAFVGDTL